MAVVEKPPIISGNASSCNRVAKYLAISPGNICSIAAVDKHEFTYAHMYETAFSMHEPAILCTLSLTRITGG